MLFRKSSWPSVTLPSLHCLLSPAAEHFILLSEFSFHGSELQGVVSITVRPSKYTERSRCLISVWPFELDCVLCQHKDYDCLHAVSLRRCLSQQRLDKCILCWKANPWKAFCFPPRGSGSALFQGAEDQSGWADVGQGPGHSLAALTHTLPALWGGPEASLTQAVEGALGVDTVPAQTGVCGCALIHI